MKPISLLPALLLTLVLSIPSGLHAQEFPKMDTSPMDLAIARDANEAPLVRVIYSRPQKRDRKIFGDLVPFGEVWRTGANEATELDIYTTMKIGDAEIEPGTYTLFTIPDEKEWTVILNKETHTWGAYSYEEELDVIRIKVPTRSAAAPIESLSMAFKPNNGEGVSLMIGWDDTFVEVPFKQL